MTGFACDRSSSIVTTSIICSSQFDERAAAGRNPEPVKHAPTLKIPQLWDLKMPEEFTPPTEAERTAQLLQAQDELFLKGAQKMFSAPTANRYHIQGMDGNNVAIILGSVGLIGTADAGLVRVSDVLATITVERSLLLNMAATILELFPSTEPA